MCKCLEFLMTPQELPGQKGEAKFVDSGMIFSRSTGDEGIKPILRALKLGKDGRLTVSSVWHPLKYCPNCGEKVEAWADSGQAPEAGAEG